VQTLRPFWFSVHEIPALEEKRVSVPAAYITVILIWSTTPLAIKWSGDEVGFLFGITSRMVLGVVTGLLVAAMFSIKVPLHAEARRTYVSAGLGIFVAMLSVYWASQFIPSGWVSVLFGLAPMVTGVMAVVWLSENVLIPTRIAGMLLGAGGLAVMFAGSEALGPDAGFGIAGMLLSVTAYSASAVAIKRIGADVPALAITIGGLLVAVPLLVTVFLLAGETLPETVPMRAAWSIVYLGLIGSVLGFALYYYVLKHVVATRVALITLVTPVIALLLGNYLNGELIQAEAWIGTAAILSGLLLYEYGQKTGRG
jgi:drug/metabolite transporter (DMT)-like permease